MIASALPIAEKVKTSEKTKIEKICPMNIHNTTKSTGCLQSTCKIIKSPKAITVDCSTEIHWKSNSRERYIGVTRAPG